MSFFVKTRSICNVYRLINVVGVVVAVGGCVVVVVVVSKYAHFITSMHIFVYLCFDHLQYNVSVVVYE